MPRIDESSLITVSLTTCSMRALMLRRRWLRRRGAAFGFAFGLTLAMAIVAAMRRARLLRGAARGELRGFAGPFGRVGVHRRAGGAAPLFSAGAPRPLAIAAAGVIDDGRAL